MLRLGFGDPAFQTTHLSILSDLTGQRQVNIDRAQHLMRHRAKLTECESKTRIYRSEQLKQISYLKR